MPAAQKEKVMAYDNSNSGALFKNNKKEEGSNQPDYNGECEIDGIKRRISAWLKTSKSGTKYMSLAFSLADSAHKPKAREPGQDDEESASIPF